MQARPFTGPRPRLHVPAWDLAMLGCARAPAVAHSPEAPVDTHSRACCAGGAPLLVDKAFFPILVEIAPNPGGPAYATLSMCSDPGGGRLIYPYWPHVLYTYWHGLRALHGLMACTWRAMSYH